MKVYEAIVKGLESIGVSAAFGGAGENAAGLMIALKHSERIRPVIARHEQAASFMACGYAMYTDRLGVCFATAGPGAFNLFSGLAVAMSDSYPVLAISGYASLDWRGRGSLNETSGPRTTSQPRPAVGSPGVMSASSCASSDTWTIGPPRSRTPPWRGRSGSPPPSRWPC